MFRDRFCLRVSQQAGLLRLSCFMRPSCGLSVYLPTSRSFMLFSVVCICSLQLKFKSCLSLSYLYKDKIISRINKMKKRQTPQKGRIN